MRAVDYPLSVKHKKRDYKGKIKSRLDLRYARFFADISNEWLKISGDLSNG